MFHSQYRHTGYVAELDGVTITGEGGAQIVQNASFAIERGERVLISGPSGSGKSTLLRALTGVENKENVSGTVYLQGKDLYAFSDSDRSAHVARHIGLGFQQPDLDGNYTVASVLRQHADLMGMPNRRQTINRMARLAAAFGFVDVLGQQVDTLSGGQKQRVALARAVLKPASMFVLDEPTHMLDRDNKAEAFKALRGIAKEDGAALVVVSHDPEAAVLEARAIEVVSGIVQPDVSPVSSRYPV